MQFQPALHEMGGSNLANPIQEGDVHRVYHHHSHLPPALLELQAGGAVQLLFGWTIRKYWDI